MFFPDHDLTRMMIDERVREAENQRLARAVSRLNRRRLDDCAPIIELEVARRRLRESPGFSSDDWVRTMDRNQMPARFLERSRRASVYPLIPEEIA